MKLSLRTRWTLGLLAVALAPLAIAMPIVGIVQRRGLLALERDLEIAVVDKAGTDTAQVLWAAEGAVHRVATALANGRIADEELRLTLARDAIASSEIVEWASVFARDRSYIGGVEVGATHGEETFPTEIPADARTGAWLHRATGSVYLEPLTADGALTGWVVGGIRKDRLDQAVAAISTAHFGRADQVVVVDERLRIVAGADGRRGRTLAGDPVFQGLSVDPAAFARPVDLHTAWTPASGEAMIGTLRTLPAQRWGVLVARAERDAFVTLAATQRTFAGLGLLLGLLAIAGGAVVARRTTRPIDDLVRLSEAYGRREFSARTSAPAGPELRTLGRSLEKMADELQTSEREIQRRAAVEAGLSRYLPEEVAAAVARGEHELGLGGRRADVTVVFADVASFTPFAERTAPEDVARFLNELFTVLSEVVFRHGGMVDKFMGDCLMAIFGVCEEGDHVQAALAAAEDMHRFVAASCEHWKERYDVEIALGIGIGSGEALVGNLGSDRRMEFTAVGDSVNVAARLEGLARPGQTLVTGAVAERGRPGFEFRSLGDHPLRGKAAPVEVFELVP